MYESKIIRDTTEWDALRRDGLDIIVDPMVVRSLHVFLAEPNQFPSDKALATQEALSANGSSLRDVVDLLVVADKIPVFNYSPSFGWGIDDNLGLFELSTEMGLGLVNVTVELKAQQLARLQALAELQNVLDRTTSLVQHSDAGDRDGDLTSLLSSIEQELSAFDYEWDPDLSTLNVEDGSLLTTAPRALRFAYGERLFDVYARAIRGTRIMASKRLQLVLQFHLPGTDELQLNRLSDPVELERLAEQLRVEDGDETVVATNVMPSFLSYILAKNPEITAPRQVIEAATALRDDDYVKDYAKALAALRVPTSDGSFPAEAIDALGESAESLVEHLFAPVARQTWPMRGTLMAGAAAPIVTEQVLTDDPVTTGILAAVGAGGWTLNRFVSYFGKEARRERAYRKFLSEVRDTQGGDRFAEQDRLVQMWSSVHGL